MNPKHSFINEAPGPDSADSGDEADLIQGRDPSYDMYVYIYEILFVFELKQRKYICNTTESILH